MIKTNDFCGNVLEEVCKINTNLQNDTKSLKDRRETIVSMENLNKWIVDCLDVCEAEAWGRHHNFGTLEWTKDFYGVSDWKLLEEGRYLRFMFEEAWEMMNQKW